MMQKLLFISLCISAFVFAQPRQNSILTETNFIPQGNGYELFFSYRIPFERIVFEKNHAGYNASFRINIEVTDSSGKFISRGMSSKKINVLSYEATISKNLFAEGLINLEVPTTRVKIVPVFTDNITNQEQRMPPVITTAIVEQSDFLSPFVVENKKSTCNGNEVSRLANFGGVVPFSKKTYDLLIPSFDTSLTSVKVVIINNKDTVLNKSITSSGVRGLELEECNGSIVISDKSSNNSFQLFRIENFNSSLEEGSITVFVSATDKFKKENMFQGDVRWFDRPFILFNQEISARTLKYLDDEELVSKVLKSDDEKYFSELLNVWKNYDPTPDTKFNELLEQYYRRVDYSIRNFSTITGKMGWETDRGEVYIKFGEPDNISRSYDDQGKVVESWSYTTTSKIFSFVDKTGTGEFVILNSK
ncbi:MAG: GWxTD domain-containing protein [Ignavibacteriales bacterium]|nr:MAG: GWxTD domain-containing protein [Ignavibacteriales bacterium]